MGRSCCRTSTSSTCYRTSIERGKPQSDHPIHLSCYQADANRIPERVVHAKGSGAHGVWECTDGLEDLCIANMFKKGTKCPITVRFSTVGRESGSSDLARDPRGFSVKFRTAEGNWDFVANNTPVFFREFTHASSRGSCLPIISVRDPAKFPHFSELDLLDLATEAPSSHDSSHPEARPRHPPFR